MSGFVYAAGVLLWFDIVSSLSVVALTRLNTIRTHTMTHVYIAFSLLSVACG